MMSKKSVAEEAVRPVRKPRPQYVTEGRVLDMIREMMLRENEVRGWISEAVIPPPKPWPSMFGAAMLGGAMMLGFVAVTYKPPAAPAPVKTVESAKAAPVPDDTIIFHNSQTGAWTGNADGTATFSSPIECVGKEACLPLDKDDGHQFRIDVYSDNCWVGVKDAQGSTLFEGRWPGSYAYIHAQHLPVTLRAGCPGSLLYYINNNQRYPENLSKTPDKSEVVELP